VIKMTWKIPLFKIYWDEEDVEAVTEAVKARIKRGKLNDK